MPASNALLTLKHQAASSTFFDPATDISFGSAHGCLDVLGALEAEGGGTLAQMVLPGQVAIALQPRADGLLRIRSGQMPASPQIDLPFAELLDLPHAQALRRIAAMNDQPEEWAAGVLALLWLMRRQGAAPLKGANILIEGNVPIGAGQASSTALLVALAQAIAQRYRLTTDSVALAQWAASAEAILGATHLPPPPASRGHIIDALTCLHPRDPRPAPPLLLRYSAQPHRFVGPVPLPDDIRIFALNTGIRHAAPRATLEEIRVAAAMGLRIVETIYRDLGQPHTPLHGYLTNTSPLLYRQYFRTLLPKRLRGNDFVRTYGPLPEDSIQLEPDTLDTPRFYRVRTAVDHLIAENEHAEQFLQAMEELAEGSVTRDERERTLQRAGRLLLASHHSYRLRLELSCREADWLVDSLMEAGPDKNVYGARITGCGGGGTVVALLGRSKESTEALLHTMKAYHQLTGLHLGVVEA